MNILTVENVSKSYGTKTLFTALNFGIADREKIGLIGVNGTGKTSLLQILVGLEQPDQGQVVKMSQLRVGYLSQNPIFDPEHTILDAALQGNAPGLKLVREYERVLRQVTQAPDDTGLQQQLLRLSQQLDQAGLWQVESDAKTILTRLGLTDFETKIGRLSGGQRKRVALAAVLINPVDLLVLDEPTNHIDNQSVDWLEQFLKDRPTALLMVTHDRYFLDRVTNRIIELDRGKLYSYTGNYSLFLEKKAERLEQEQAVAAKQQNLFRRELAWMRRGAQARSTKQQARIGRFEQLQTELVKDEAPAQVELTVVASRLGKKVLQIEAVRKSYGAKVVIADFSYGFTRDDRVGVIGANGIGKSTLLNLIVGNIQPDQGRIEVGPTVKFGFFTQEGVALPEDLRVIDYIKAIAENIPTTDGGTVSASQMLERFLFTPTMQWTPINHLSGGERRRLDLLRVLMGAPNVLLLDEPTNDLDIQTLSVLEDYLDEFPGVVIAVSHDRYFLDRIAGKILAFEPDGRIQHFVGNYSDYRDFAAQRENEATETGPTGKKTALETSKPQNAPRERPLRLSYQEQRELDGIETVIAGVEGELAELKIQLDQAGSDYQRLQELTAAQENLEKRLDHLLERWAYLNERAAEVARNKT